MPEKPIQAITTAKLWHKLITEVIGHKQYVCQGGDLGAAVTVQLAYLYPESVKAIHFNLTPWFSIPADQQTEAEKEWLAEGENYLAREMDYFRMQTNKPKMPRGGHFAALEQPELFVDDLRAAFRPFHEEYILEQENET